jgi:predicted ABC-type ATPase
MDPTEIRRQAKRLTKDNAYIQDAYKKIIGSRDFSSIKTPAAVFMAGSPGAGKTEVAKEISRLFNPEPVHIDADDFRTQFPGYNGKNSSLFQQPATDMVQKILDRILHTAKNGQAIPFILDGTFSYARVQDNIKRALSRGYVLEIYYIYQKPMLAWKFTKARKVIDGRSISEDVFIKTFILARDNVLTVKKIFGDNISVSMIMKDDDAKSGKVCAYLSYGELEKILPMSYDEETIRKELRNS